MHPFYVYVHDLVKGTEDLRTSVATAIQVEKRLRGATAGFNTPPFVVDAPGGGGKRDTHSHEHYDPERGISVYTAPSVKKDKLFMYFDPPAALSPYPAKEGIGIVLGAQLEAGVVRPRGRPDVAHRH